MKYLALVAFALCVAQPAFAADEQPEAPIMKMMDAFNKGDVAGAKAVHVAAPSILDEPVAPYLWTGRKAFDSWIAALGKSEAASGKTGGKVSLDAPLRRSVMGDHAYIVVPSTYTFMQSGRTMRETGTMTFALVRMGKAWKIAAWTWSSPEAVPVG